MVKNKTSKQDEAMVLVETVSPTESLLSVFDGKDLCALKKRVEDCLGDLSMLRQEIVDELIAIHQELEPWVYETFEQDYALLRLAIQSDFPEALELLLKAGVSPIFYEPEGSVASRKYEKEIQDAYSRRRSGHVAKWREPEVVYRTPLTPEQAEKEKQLRDIEMNDLRHFLSGSTDKHEADPLGLKIGSHILMECMEFDVRLSTELTEQLILAATGDFLQVRLLSWAASHPDLDYLKCMIGTAGWRVREPALLEGQPWRLRSWFDTSRPLPQECSRDGIVLYAAKDDLLENLKYLMESGGNVNGGIDREQTESPLVDAIHKKQYKAAMYLIDQGALESPKVEKSLSSSFYDGHYGYDRSVPETNKEVTQYIFKWASDRLPASLGLIQTMMKVAAIWERWDLVEQCLSMGAKVNGTELAHGFLHMCAKSKKWGASEVLQKVSKQLTAKDLNQRLDPYLAGRIGFHNLGTEDLKGDLVLLMACHHHDLSVLSELITAGADPGEVDARGNNLAHRLLLWDDSEEVMLEKLKWCSGYGIDFNQPNLNKETAIDQVREWNRMDVVNWMVSCQKAKECQRDLDLCVPFSAPHKSNDSSRLKRSL